MGLSSSASNLVLRNVISLTLHTKKWIGNNTVSLPFLCQNIPQILSLSRTQAIMILQMPPKFQTVFQWIQIKVPKICLKTQSALNLTVMHMVYPQLPIGTMPSIFSFLQCSLILTPLRPWATFLDQFVFPLDPMRMTSHQVTHLKAMILHSLP